MPWNVRPISDHERWPSIPGVRVPYFCACRMRASAPSLQHVPPQVPGNWLVSCTRRYQRYFDLCGARSSCEIPIRPDQTDRRRHEFCAGVRRQNPQGQSCDTKDIPAPYWATKLCVMFSPDARGRLKLQSLEKRRPESSPDLSHKGKLLAARLLSCKQR
jgi:hypothetical protein